MRKSRSLRLSPVLRSLGLCLVLALATACPPDGSVTTETGYGYITIEVGNSAKDLTPNVSLDVSYYVIEGKGPDDDFSIQLSDGTTATTEELNPGSWTVKATAFNAAKTPIMEKSDE